MKLELRMYGLVPYNISPIQQAIQFGHGVVEYAQKYFKDANYQDWAKNHKTFIILNGGTTNEGRVSVTSDRRYTGMSINDLGSIQQHWLKLDENNIKKAIFREPDLNDTMTSIVFLVDERVFNRTAYPDFVIDTNASIKEQNKNYSLWVKSIGGPKNAFLRDYLKQFRLA